MIFNARDISKITSTIASAALDNSKWQAVLDELCQQIPGIKTHLFGHDLATNSILGVKFSGYDPLFVDSYTEYYGEQNPWAPKFIEADIANPMTVDWMIPHDEMVKTEFYNDWVLPQENIVAGGGTLLFKEDKRLFALGANIRACDRQLLEQPWLELIGLIGPHLQQAFEINRALGGLSIEKFASRITGNSRNTAIFVLAFDGHILFSSDFAQTQLESGDVVGLKSGRKLQFINDQADQKLEKTLNHFIANRCGVPLSFEVLDSHNDKSYSCRTLHFKPSLLSHSPFGNLIGEDEPCIILTLVQNTSLLEISSLLVGRCGLTIAEAQIACRVVKGQTPREISKMRNVSIYTVRAQLKSAMSKLNVNRQIELVRLVEDIIGGHQISLIADQLQY